MPTVVKLFNMIQQVQASEGASDDDTRAKYFKRNSTKKESKKESSKDETGKSFTDRPAGYSPFDSSVHLGQDDFLSMIKSGGTVLKD